MERSFLQPDEELLLLLCKHSVSVKMLILWGGGEQWVRQVLTSSMSSSLEDLELTGTKQDLVHIVQSILRPNSHFSQWQLTAVPEVQQQLADLIPWSRTLTRLSLRLPLDSRRNKLQGVATLGSVRALLLMLPQLEDLELATPLMDLELFDGLGRKEASVDGHKGTNEQSGSAFVNPLEISRQSMENYCMTERPLLKRLCLHQSFQYADLNGDRPLTPWRTQLLHKFRLMTDLQLLRQVTPRK